MAAKMTTSRGHAHGRMIGLGQPPSELAIGNILNTGFTQVPVIEYVTWTTQVPLSDVDAAATFPSGGRGVDILQTDSPIAGIDSVDTSFVRNGILQASIWVIGFGVHIFGEPMTFSQIGNVLTPVPTTSTATPVSPDVFTLNDQDNAGNVLGIPEGSDLLPGILKWGHDSWQAAWHFANAYQFIWRFNQRQILIQELVADLSYFGPYADGVAAGTSEVDVLEYARRANDRSTANAQGGTGVFVPINARRIGSVTAPLGLTGNVGVFHPTRDFDLAPVTYGGIRNQGQTGCCQPFRKLACPVFLEKGIPIGMQLQSQDDYHWTQFQQHVRLTDIVGDGGTLATATAYATDSGTSAAGNAMPELLLDVGANAFEAQQVVTSRTLVKGGTMKFSILIKGYEVWGDWLQYFASGGADGRWLQAGG